MILETERLILRELNQDDYYDLCEILQDKDVMYAYEHAFSDNEAHEWLDRQIGRYANCGFGLWAVILKETGEFIGQAGLTIQDFNGVSVTEIGYLFKKIFWHKGYALEAAEGCKRYAFLNTLCDEVYSIIRDNNIPSQNVAVRNGMEICGRVIKHYYDVDMPHYVYRIKKS